MCNQGGSCTNMGDYYEKEAKIIMHLINHRLSEKHLEYGSNWKTEALDINQFNQLIKKIDDVAILDGSELEIIKQEITNIFGVKL